MLCCSRQRGEINSHPKLGLLTHYRQILIKSKHTLSLNIGISASEKKCCCVPCQLSLNMNDLLHIYLCVAQLLTELWDLAVQSFWFQDQKLKLLLAYWLQLRINSGLGFIVLSHTTSIIHIPVINRVTTFNIYTLKWKLMFWAYGCYWLWQKSSQSNTN